MKKSVFSKQKPIDIHAAARKCEIRRDKQHKIFVRPLLRLLCFYEHYTSQYTIIPNASNLMPYTDITDVRRGYPQRYRNKTNKRCQQHIKDYRKHELRNSPRNFN